MSSAAGCVCLKGVACGGPNMLIEVPIHSDAGLIQEVIDE
jgi:hypothetical protein